MAPEVVNADKKQNIGYNEKCDMWSIGIIAYTLLTGHHPLKLIREE
jgi:serine/threonine protein kinase